MKTWLNRNKKAVFISLGTFLLLFSGLMLLILFYDFSDTNLGGLLFLVSMLGCVLAAKNMYDVTRKTSITREYKKNIEADLAVSSDQIYLQLYKNSPVPYLILDVEGKVRSANIAAVRMLGMSDEKVVDINIFTRLESEALEHFDFLVDKYNSGLAISDEVVKVKRDDKNEVWALMSLFGFDDTSGERIGLLTLVDITKQKKAEDAKSEFVSLASHQLRTPIAGMKWSAELLQLDNPENLTERQHKYVDRLLISIRRMSILVDDFLRVSRFELGTFQPEYQTVKMSELIKDVMEDQEVRVGQKKLIVKTFFEDGIDEIVTDPNLMRMIVTNLYSNAVKYTREEGTIHVGLGKKGEDLSLTVADNGIGIPAKDQEDVFSKLFRASNAVRDVPDGTGLGLYIVKSAVSVLKGQISFTTTENTGTTFEVVLPLELPNVN